MAIKGSLTPFYQGQRVSIVVQLLDVPVDEDIEAETFRFTIRRHPTSEDAVLIKTTEDGDIDADDEAKQLTIAFMPEETAPLLGVYHCDVWRTDGDDIVPLFVGTMSVLQAATKLIEIDPGS